MIKKLKMLLLLFLCLTVFITKPNAKTNNKDLFQSGESITIDEKLDGTSFISGNEVKLNETINGIGFIAGNEIDINATQEFLFGFASNTNIKADIEKDLFIFSSTINLDSKVKRDAYIAGEEINIDGVIERNIYIYGTEINLNGTFNGNVTVYGTVINIGDKAAISGTLKYNEDALIEGINDRVTTKTYNTVQNISLKEYITNFFSSYIHILLLAIVLVFINENLFKKSLKQTEQCTTKTIATLCGKGFLILIGVPIIAIMLLFSGIFVSVGIVGGIIYGILVYISNIFTAYFIADLLDKKVLKKNMNSYILMILGLFIIYVISLIPIIGGIISFISILLGLGISGNMIIEMKK